MIFVEVGPLRGVCETTRRHSSLAVSLESGEYATWMIWEIQIYNLRLCTRCSPRLDSGREVFTKVCHSDGVAPKTLAPGLRRIGRVKHEPPPLASTKYVVLLSLKGWTKSILCTKARKLGGASGEAVLILAAPENALLGAKDYLLKADPMELEHSPITKSSNHLQEESVHSKTVWALSFYYETLIQARMRNIHRMMTCTSDSRWVWKWRQSTNTPTNALQCFQT